MLHGVCLKVKSVGKPDAVAPHVRFDERGWETGLYATAPILDSTVSWPAFYYKQSETPLFFCRIDLLTWRDLYPILGPLYLLNHHPWRKLDELRSYRQDTACRFNEPQN